MLLMCLCLVKQSEQRDALYFSCGDCFSEHQLQDLLCYPKEVKLCGSFTQRFQVNSIIAIVRNVYFTIRVK